MATWGQIREQVIAEHPTASFQQVDNWINDGYELILSQRDWSGLKSSMTLRTGTVYSAGSITLSAGSASVVGTGTAWTPDMTGLQVQIGGRNEVYEVTILTATTATLDRPFEGGGADGQGYKFFQQTYGLSQNVKNVIRLYNPHLVDKLDEKPLSDLRAMPPTFGEPMWFAKDMEEGENPTVKGIALYPVPLTSMGLPMDFYRVARGFSGTNTEDSPLPWVSPGFLKNYAIAMGYKPASGERESSMAEAEKFAAAMHNEENRKVPPTKITVAARYTRHERERRRW